MGCSSLFLFLFVAGLLFIVCKCYRQRQRHHNRQIQLQVILDVIIILSVGPNLPNIGTDELELTVTPALRAPALRARDNQGF